MSAGTLQKLSPPDEENVIFVTPESSKWTSLLARNKLITQNIPRRPQARKELLAIARSYTQGLLGLDRSDGACAAGNAIATGHQAIWHHCGIWAKNYVICKLARATRGCAVHIVLDHDVRDTAMALPSRDAAGGWSCRRVAIETAQREVPLEVRGAPAQEHIQAFVAEVVKASPGSLCSSVWPQCTPLTGTQRAHFAHIAELITYYQAVLNVALGLDSMIYLPVSRLCESEAFLDFASSIILDAPAFAASYNKGVAKQSDLRQSSRADMVRSLRIDAATGLTELPFWLISPGGRRATLYARRDGTGRVRIGTAYGESTDLDSALSNGKGSQLKTAIEKLGHRLRPKAVPLTLFARLFLADLFVHGVGGARYEAVTDHVIHEYYHMEISGFGVATCTMTLHAPNPAASRQNGLSQLRHRLHDIRHNPEKYIGEPVLNTDAVTALLRSKQQMLAKATDRSLPRSAKKSAWGTLAAINQKLFEYAKTDADVMEKTLAHGQRNAMSRQVCSRREYFYGLFPEEEFRKTAGSLAFAEHA